MQIHSIFKSIEGEGINQGFPTTFIRTQGCTIKCKWCDQKETWKDVPENEIPLEEIVEKVKSLTIPGNIVSITGGDPMLWLEELPYLTKSLINEGYRINLEHNGMFTNNFKMEMKFLESFEYVSFDIKPPSAMVDIEKVMEGIPKILPYKYNFSIKCVVQTPDDLHFFAKYVLPLKDHRTHLTFIPCNIVNAYINTPLIVREIINLLDTNKTYNVKLGFQLHKVFNFE